MHKKLAELVAVVGPDRVMPGSFVHYDLQLENNGDDDWPPGARAIVAGAVSDEAPLELGTVREGVAAGTIGALAIDFRAPRDEQVLALPVAILDGDRVIAEFDLAVTVSNDRPLEANDADDLDDAPAADVDDDGATS